MKCISIESKVFEVAGDGRYVNITERGWKVVKNLSLGLGTVRWFSNALEECLSVEGKGFYTAHRDGDKGYIAQRCINSRGKYMALEFHLHSWGQGQNGLEKTCAGVEGSWKYWWFKADVTTSDDVTEFKFLLIQRRSSRGQRVGEASRRERCRESRSVEVRSRHFFGWCSVAGWRWQRFCRAERGICAIGSV